MGFLKLFFGFMFGMMALRAVRAVLGNALPPRSPGSQFNPPHPAENATVELVACPYCHVYTTPPCTNPDCPGRPRD